MIDGSRNLSTIGPSCILVGGVEELKVGLPPNTVTVADEIMAGGNCDFLLQCYK